MSRNNAAAQAQLIKMTSQIVSWCRTACRTSAWTLALAIVVLSLVPPSYRPVTEASHSFEHLAIFLVTGLAFGAGYPGRPFRIAVALVIFSGTVELLQQWVPGRHARLSDFLVDGTAAEFRNSPGLHGDEVSTQNSIPCSDGALKGGFPTPRAGPCLDRDRVNICHKPVRHRADSSRRP